MADSELWDPSDEADVTAFGWAASSALDKSLKTADGRRLWLSGVGFNDGTSSWDWPDVVGVGMLAFTERLLPIQRQNGANEGLVQVELSTMAFSVDLMCAIQMILATIAMHSVMLPADLLTVMESDALAGPVGATRDHLRDAFARWLDAEGIDAGADTVADNLVTATVGCLRDVLDHWVSAEPGQGVDGFAIERAQRWAEDAREQVNHARLASGLESNPDYVRLTDPNERARRIMRDSPDWLLCFGDETPNPRREMTARDLLQTARAMVASQMEEANRHIQGRGPDLE